MQEMLEQYKDVAVVILGIMGITCLISQTSGVVGEIILNFLSAVMFR
jgi:hypothetical protein